MTSAAPTGATKSMNGEAATKAASATRTGGKSGKSHLKPSYWPFVLPALITVGAVIVFPWLFTLWMSTNQWQLGGGISFVGFDNYIRLAADARFWDSMWHTAVYTVLSVVAPMVLGTIAALIFDSKLPMRGLLRGIFVMPMMATPVAVALVWTMMYHPQLGVLNYLLSLIGIGPQEWIFNQNTVIPSLVAVETWQWTPLVMLIVLGGLASMPRDPFESAEIDGANGWQKFRYITLPMILPFIMVAVIIRSIDALKSFDIIYAMTQGGPGTASETINIYLYNVAFSYYDIGYASAIAVVFFIVIIAMSMILLALRQRTKWNA
ncbi:carbohydrate ABC transporter permease [Ochrobactrum teleogrylli]|uniref:Sugar ABC transporter permease n=1 Tax=Ochrobactrum teleogrylli TaxID=2479765 RepID=A0ABD5JVB7_9HYPH